MKLRRKTQEYETELDELVHEIKEQRVTWFELV